jgi:CO/xanthine dehydrogenase FAD-binding subunit
MKPAPFEYLAPQSLEEALQVMNQHGADAKLLAGGQSLIPVMNFRLAQPAMIVDLNGVAELGHLQLNGAGRLRIGAMVRQRELEFNPIVSTAAPLLHETMPYVAHPQIRNRGTVGGSLAHADPAAELPVVAIALEAEFRLARLGIERWIRAEDFYEGLFTTALQPEEILVEIEIPPFPTNTGCAFTELARRHGDYAQAGVATLVTLDDGGRCQNARLVFLAVGETSMTADQAVTALIGERPSARLIAEVARAAAQEEIDPLTDIHATADYKRHLAQVLARRALQLAVDRATAQVRERVEV